MIYLSHLNKSISSRKLNVILYHQNTKIALQRLH